MSENIGKFGGKLKRAVIFVGLFSAILWSLFQIINLNLDNFRNNPAKEKSPNYLFEGKNASTGSFSTMSFEQWAQVNGLSGKDIANDDTDKDGLSNHSEFIHGTDPNNPDTDWDGYPDGAEINAGYDPDEKSDMMLVVGIEIEKIGVKAPMVWSKTENEKEMLQDLERGIAHFAKTAAPGQNGNMIVSGHSSNYIWAKGDYNHVFRNLGDLEKGDVVVVKSMQKNGRIISYKYVVNDKFTTSPDDERIFAETKNPTLTLSTCWPIGTTLKRTIIKADLAR